MRGREGGRGGAGRGGSEEEEEKEEEEEEEKEEEEEEEKEEEDGNVGRSRMKNFFCALIENYGQATLLGLTRPPTSQKHAHV